MHDHWTASYFIVFVLSLVSAIRAASAAFAVPACIALTLSSSLNGVGTNFGVGGRRGEARRADSGGWGSWAGDSQPLPPTRGFAGALSGPPTGSGAEPRPP